MVGVIAGTVAVDVLLSVTAVLGVTSEVGVISSVLVGVTSSVDAAVISVTSTVGASAAMVNGSMVSVGFEDSTSATLTVCGSNAFPVSIRTIMYWCSPTVRSWTVA